MFNFFGLRAVLKVAGFQFVRLLPYNRIELSGCKHFRDFLRCQIRFVIGVVISKVSYIIVVQIVALNQMTT